MNASACGPDTECITCGDVGVPMRALDVRAGTAVCVDQEGTRHEIAVDLIESVRREQWLLVHAGVAIAEVDAPAGEAATTGGDR